MKSLIYSAIALISVASTLAAPTAEPVTDLEKRTSVWQPGKKQPCPLFLFLLNHRMEHTEQHCREVPVLLSLPPSRS